MTRKRRETSRKDKLLNQSSQFSAFSRLFEAGSKEAQRKAEKDAILAKVSAGLAKVCGMLADRIKE